MISARPRSSNNIPRLIVNLASIMKFKHFLLKNQIDGEFLLECNLCFINNKKNNSSNEETQNGNLFLIKVPKRHMKNMKGIKLDMIFKFFGQ
jgi:uncharacterized C2H2 Zn-finger protein